LRDWGIVNSGIQEFRNLGIGGFKLNLGECTRLTKLASIDDKGCNIGDSFIHMGR